MTVGGRLIVLGFAQLEVARQRSGTTVEFQLDYVGDALRGQSLPFGAVGLDEQGERLGHSDGVRELYQRALAELGGHDALGHPPTGVGGRSIDLGGILSGEGPAAVGAPSAVGVDDDLASGESGVSLGTADDEFPRWIQVDVTGVSVVDGERALSVLEGDGFERLEDDVIVD